MSSSPGEVTRLLHALGTEAPEEAAFGQLFDLVYDELRRQAHRQRAGWASARTLNTTALVHEAYAKLVGGADVAFESRAHLLAVSARAMRQVLLDYAKAQRAQKRGGGRDRVTLLEDGPGLGTDEPTSRLFALEGALARLSVMSEEAARIVECRFFAGMSVEETAAALGLSESTVKRRWRTARAWLYRTLADESLAGDDDPS